MATQVRFRRGSTTDHATFTGVQGEVTVDTDLNTIRVHDGSTQGGHRVLLHSEFSASSGTITNIATGSGLTGGPITTTGTIAIDSTTLTKIDQSYAWGDHSVIGYLTNLTTSTIGTLSDVEITNPQANEVLAYNTNGNKWVNVSQSGGGGGGTFLSLSDTPSSFTGHTGKVIAVNQTTNGLEFVPMSGESNTVTNRGAGEGSVFYTKTGVDFELRTIKAGNNITISQNSNEITINSGTSAFGAGDGINVDLSNVISVDNTVLRTTGNYTTGGVITFSQSPIFSTGFSTTQTLNIPITGTSAREVFLKSSITDATNDFLDISNLSTSSGLFSPAIRGGVYTASNIPALTLTGEVPSNRDTGSTPVIEFIVRRGSNVTHSGDYGVEASLGTRSTYFDFKNHTTSLFSIGSTGVSVDTDLTVNGTTSIPHNLKFKNSFNLLSGLQSGINATTYPGCFAIANNIPYFSATSNSGEWIELAKSSNVPNVYNSINADAGGGANGLTAPSAQSKVMFAGGVDIDTAVAYDSGTGVTTVTITNTGGGGGSGTTQDLWYRINGNTGYITPNSSTDILTISGTNGISTTANADEISISHSIDSIKTISVAGQSDVSVSGYNQPVTFAAGNNMTITTSGSTITFASTGGGGSSSNSFETISVSGQSDIVAESATDTLTLVAGSGIGITTDGSNDAITISNTANAAYAFTNLAVSGQTTVTAETAADTLTLVGGSGISITTDAPNDSITITSTASGGGNAYTTIATPNGTNPVAGTSSDTLTFAEGSGITITGNASSDTITIASSGSGFDRRLLSATTYVVSGASSSYYYMFMPDGSTRINEGTSGNNGQNPTLYVLSGTTVCFDLTTANNNGSHPFYIKSTNTGTSGSSDAYNTGLIHYNGTSTYLTGSSAQGQTSGYLFWTIPTGISGNYGYQCQSHSGMLGTIIVKDIKTI